MNKLNNFISKLLTSYLTQTSEGRAKPTTNNIELLTEAIRPGDVLLVEGKQRFSTAIKYLTQSNWSHVAIYIGKREDAEHELLEADLEKGVITIPLSTYATYHTRICRPVHLTDDDLESVIKYCLARLGHTYDLKNIFDLARYLLPLPPIPTKFKRSVLTFGSGDPTKAICSSLIAEAFQKIKYPILPHIKKKKEKKLFSKFHPSFFVPSDFDRSPYFDIIKPTTHHGFNYKELVWESEDDD